MSQMPKLSRSSSLNLSSMVEEQVANVSAELNEMGPSSPTIFGSWELKALKVRVAASVGFILPFLISAVLVPELELVFESSDVG